MNVLTLSGVRDYLLDRLKFGKPITETQRKEINEYISTKIELYQKDIGKDKAQDKRDFELIRTMCNFFLKDDVSPFKLPHSIHPSGILKPGLVVEPISPWLYVYNWCGIRNETQAQAEGDSKKYFIEIEGEVVYLEDMPIKEFAYELPDREYIQKWIRNEIDVKSTKELWDMSTNYFKLFGDLALDCFYDVLALYVFETWLSQMLPSLFYVGIFGRFGGGKTTLAEMATEISRHGICADPSAAFIARVIDAQGASIFIDELDSIIRGNTDDNDMLSIIRKGYRRGNSYARMDVNLNPKFFNVFGAKLFTIHSIAEDALQTRTIPIMTTESSDVHIAIVNQARKKFQPYVYNNFNLWYLTKSISLDMLNKQNEKSDNLDVTRETLFKDLTAKLKPHHLKELMKLRGRNSELGFVVAQILSLVEEDGDLINLAETLKDVFEAKKQIEEERLEVGRVGEIRDQLAQIWRNKNTEPEYITNEGWVKISNKECERFISEYFKNKHEHNFSSKDYVKALREFGFEAPNTRKKLRVNYPGEEGNKVRMCNIFDDTVLLRLGLPVAKVEIATKLNTQQ